MTFMERFAKGMQTATPEEGVKKAAALISLQVLFDRDGFPTAEALKESLSAYDPLLDGASVEFEAALDEQGEPVGTLGIIAWDEHVVNVVGFGRPMPSEVLDVTVDVAPFGDDFRAAARAHRGHALLMYVGEGANLVGQYVALAAVAGALAEHGGIVVLNEAARSALPTDLLRIDPDSPDVDPDVGAMEVMADLPLLLLYCGFVRFPVEGFDGLWMRTFGCDRIGLPDLALLAPSAEQGQATFDLFSNVLGYLRKSGATLKDGDTMQIEADAFLRVRHPTAAESFLDDDPGSILVAEIISPDQVTPPAG